MARRRWWVGGSCLGAVLLAGDLARAQHSFVGSDACKPCHEAQWNAHRASGHPHPLRRVEAAESWPLPLPEGYDWNDIRYVVGGYKWKTLYLGSDGNIITAAGGEDGNNQYNVATGEWVDYHAGEVTPYDCGECHTTGYSPSGSQDGLPGIQGTWEFEGVQCERCHGPASAHVALPTSLNIAINDQACQSCHTRGDPAKIPASGGFVRENTQYNELLASPHVFFDCSTCHDPHQKSEFSIKVACTDCHVDMAEPKAAYKKLGLRHDGRGVECIDCHMPYAAKSAVAVNKYQADLRSHQFRITLDQNATMFSPEGTLANGQLTAAYACLGCHENIVEQFAAKGMPEKAEKWARDRAKKIHK